MIRCVHVLITCFLSIPLKMNSINQYLVFFQFQFFNQSHRRVSNVISQSQLLFLMCFFIFTRFDEIFIIVGVFQRWLSHSCRFMSVRSSGKDTIYSHLRIFTSWLDKYYCVDGKLLNSTLLI